MQSIQCIRSSSLVLVDGPIALMIDSSVLRSHGGLAMWLPLANTMISVMIRPVETWNEACPSCPLCSRSAQATNSSQSFRHVAAGQDQQSHWPTAADWGAVNTYWHIPQGSMIVSGNCVHSRAAWPLPSISEWPGTLEMVSRPLRCSISSSLKKGSRDHTNFLLISTSVMCDGLILKGMTYFQCTCRYFLQKWVDGSRFPEQSWTIALLEVILFHSTET